MIIGLTGLIGSGKSEVARILTEEYGFVRVKFADPLKNMIRTMLTDMGHTAHDAERYVEGNLKESVVHGLHDLGITARHLMQQLGTAFGRDAIHPELWVTLWRAKAERFERVLADDVRFPNEVAAVRALAGKIWHLDRPGTTQGAHASEQLATEPDLTVYNHGTLDDLAKNVRYLASLAGL